MNGENVIMIKKKILFVIESLGCGGAEKSLISLLSSLDKERYDLSIWMMYPKGAFLSFLPNDVNVIKQPKYNVFESMLLYLSSILYSVIWRLNKMVGKSEYWGETYS